MASEPLPLVDVATGAVPPGQRLTRRFPVTGEDGPGVGDLDRSTFRLDLVGLLRAPTALRFDDLVALGPRTLRADIHCVTGWSRLACTFTGVPLREVLAAAGGTGPGARFVRFEATSARAHDTSLPLDVAVDDAWVVWDAGGEPLDVAHGGPVRIVTPSRYFSKSCKWVRLVEVLAEDRLGYWERTSGYHNDADPWPGDRRFVSGSVRPEQLARFLAATEHDKYRDRPLIGVDLRAWTPVALGCVDLRSLALKGCDLRGVDLTGVDLRGANLSLSDLRGARLVGADLSGADVEGADFEGADLTDANLSGAACAATNVVGATVTGLRWAGAAGLLEDSEAWLRANAPEGGDRP
ncbi:MAG: hypothetical protein FJW83_02405 [Actinobacteria bacterium]|nr:hypothetical protein [Actinomycetota bacterium]